MKNPIPNLSNLPPELHHATVENEPRDSDILSTFANIDQTLLVNTFLEPMDTMQHLAARQVLFNDRPSLSFVYISVGSLPGIPCLPSGVTFVVEYVDDSSVRECPCFQYNHALNLKVLRLPLDRREPVLFTDSEKVEEQISCYLNPLKVRILNVVANQRCPVHLVDAAKHLDVVLPYDLRHLVEGILAVGGRVHIHNRVRMGSYYDRHLGFTPAFISLSPNEVKGVDLACNRLPALGNTLFGSTPQVHSLLLHLVRTRGEDQNDRVKVAWCESEHPKPLTALTKAQRDTYVATGVMVMKSPYFTHDPVNKSV